MTDDFIIEDTREEVLSVDELMDALQERGIKKVYDEVDYVAVETTDEYKNRPVQERIYLGLLLFEVLERRDVVEDRLQPVSLFFDALDIDETHYETVDTLAADEKLTKVDDGYGGKIGIPFHRYHDTLDELNISY